MKKPYMVGRLWIVQVNHKRAVWLTFQPAWPVTSNIYRFCFCGNILDTKEPLTFELQLRLKGLPCYTPALDFLGKDSGKPPIYFQTCSRIRNTLRFCWLVPEILTKILAIGLMHSLHLQLIIVAIVDVEPDLHLKKILEISHPEQKTLDISTFCLKHLSFSCFPLLSALLTIPHLRPSHGDNARKAFKFSDQLRSKLSTTRRTAFWGFEAKDLRSWRFRELGCGVKHFW